MKTAKATKKTSKTPSADVRYFCLLIAMINAFKGARLIMQRDESGYVLLIADKRCREPDDPVIAFRVQEDTVSFGYPELDEAGQMISFDVEAEGLPLSDPETLLETLYSIAIGCMPRDEFAEARDAFQRAMRISDQPLLAHYLIDVNIVDVARSLGVMNS